MDATKILLVTVTKIETQAVFDVFEQAISKKREAQRINNKTYYTLGKIGSTEVFLVQSEIGASSPGGSLTTISQAIENINPSEIIMVGLAFGVRPGRQKLGDILVSHTLAPYEFQKTNNQALLRGERVNASLSLIDLARSTDFDWKQPKVHIGLILSGEKLVNNLEFRDQLIKNAPEAIGGEMEGSGLYTAATVAKVNWIMVKAIADWADGAKTVDGVKNQSLAARNAARFVLAMIQHINNLPKDVPIKSSTPRKTSSKGARTPPPNNPPNTTIVEPPQSELPAEASEIINQYTIQDNALEKHAASDKPIQNTEQDKLGFGIYVTALHDFIVSQYTTTPLTISVDGPWGAGKSSLMYMLKNSLEPQNNIWQRFASWLIVTFQWWAWFFLWFFSLPVQTFGRVMVWIALKFDKDTEEFDFRIGKSNPVFKSLITDIAQGLSTNPEVLQQKDNELSTRVIWWVKVHANCQPLEAISHPTIWLNAWKFDNQEEVWASLALATLEQLKQKHNILWMMWFRIRLTFKRMSFLSALGTLLFQFALPLVLGVVAFYYTVILESFETPLKAFDTITQGFGNYLLWAGGILSGILTVSSIFKDPFQISVDKVFDRPNYKEKVGFLTRFEHDFAKVIELATSNGFGWKKSKLIIFIDDLDRCEPPKSADIVEAINLFLDADGCVFVIGMDSESVAKSIEVKYKDLFDRIKAENGGVISLGRAFLEKIVQIPFTVPRATSSQILKMVEDTLGANISKGISIAQPKEKDPDETKDGQPKKENKQDQVSTQTETTSELAESEKTTAEPFDPASFAREEVRQAIRLGTELLSENPRQAKTFVNLFRLSIYIANARAYFEEKRVGDQIDLLGLDRLAYWVVCSVRWQNLVRHLYQETQIDSLCGFLHEISQNITANYRWTTGRKNIPAKVKKKFDDLRQAEKGVESHWCHLPWDWWLLEPDFLKIVKLLEILWMPSTDEDSEMNMLLNMSRPLSQTTSTETK